MGLKNPKWAGHFLFFFQTGRKLKSKHFTRLRTTVEAKKRSLVITFQNLVGTLLAMFFSLCYRQLILELK